MEGYNRQKSAVIAKLTLLDTKYYRRSGFIDNGTYPREPKNFRNKLYLIYDKLSIEDLTDLLNLKTK